MGAMALASTPDPFERSTGQFVEIRDFAGSREADDMTESELERELEIQVRELKRRLMQDALDRRRGGAAIGLVRDEAGRERTEVREHTRTLRTTFGEVTVRRLGYGEDGLSSLHPLDGELNLAKEADSP